MAPPSFFLPEIYLSEDCPLECAMAMIGIAVARESPARHAGRRGGRPRHGHQPSLACAPYASRSESAAVYVHSSKTEIGRTANNSD
jgi:hypothetical protein